MCVRASYMKLTRDTHLMQQFIYYYKQLYMFRASICPSSGVLGCIRIIYRCPKHVELFIMINKLLHQVGISRQFLHKLGAARSVDLMFIVGAPAWR